MPIPSPAIPIAAVRKYMARVSCIQCGRALMPPIGVAKVQREIPLRKHPKSADGRCKLQVPSWRYLLRCLTDIDLHQPTPPCLVHSTYCLSRLGRSSGTIIHILLHAHLSLRVLEQLHHHRLHEYLTLPTHHVFETHCSSNLGSCTAANIHQLEDIFGS